MELCQVAPLETLGMMDMLDGLGKQGKHGNVDQVTTTNGSGCSYSLLRWPKVGLQA